MNTINKNRLILEERVFTKEAIKERMISGGFKMLSKFELFIWDLEIFLQLHSLLGDKIILKGGAAVQFYIPIDYQRTSIDIDMICLASKNEVASAILHLENTFQGLGEIMKFRKHIPKHPRVSLEMLDTYFITVPTICSKEDLSYSRGKQEVKAEFIYSKNSYSINQIQNPFLFALQTTKTFNIISLEELFADKLTTLGPNTIGIGNERQDEQLKQVYDIITLFENNYMFILEKKDIIKLRYWQYAKTECGYRNVAFNPEEIYYDVYEFICNLQGIENNHLLYREANNFQSLYLRRQRSRGRGEWAIIGYKLQSIFNAIVKGDKIIDDITNIERIIAFLRFEHITGIERGQEIQTVREIFIQEFSEEISLTCDLLKKNFERIIWELVAKGYYFRLLLVIEKYHLCVDAL